MLIGEQEGTGLRHIDRVEVMNMKVKVLFFGVLTDVTGKSFMHYNEVKDISDLKHRIIDDFPQVVHYDYLISLNNEIINSNSELKNDDEVALLPPFAGG